MNYPPPSRIPHLIFWSGIFFTLFLIFRMFGGEKIFLSQSKLMRIDWPTQLEFCGEKVPLDDFYIREAWEKEFLVTLARDYQNILYLNFIDQS